MSPEERARAREKLQNSDPQERARWRERWQQMTPEERAKFRESRRAQPEAPTGASNDKPASD